MRRPPPVILSTEAEATRLWEAEHDGDRRQPSRTRRPGERGDEVPEPISCFRVLRCDRRPSFGAPWHVDCWNNDHHICQVANPDFQHSPTTPQPVARDHIAPMRYEEEGSTRNVGVSQKVPANVVINSGTSSIRIGYDGRTNEYNINIDTTTPMIDKIEPYRVDKTVEHDRPPDTYLGNCPNLLTLQGELGSQTVVQVSRRAKRGHPEKNKCGGEAEKNVKPKKKRQVGRPHMDSQGKVQIVWQEKNPVDPR